MSESTARLVCGKCGNHLAEYDVYGEMYETRGFLCWRCAHLVIGCCCTRCEKQSAWRRLRSAA